MTYVRSTDYFMTRYDLSLILSFRLKIFFVLSTGHAIETVIYS
jgi:hypothetical protein